jgi:hypothetical protein
MPIHTIILLLFGVNPVFTFTLMYLLSKTESKSRRDAFLGFYILTVNLFERVTWLKISPVLAIMMIRLLLLIVIPWYFRKITSEYRPIPILETAMRRAWRESQKPSLDLSSFILIYIGIKARDSSEPFSVQLRAKFIENFGDVKSWSVLQNNTDILIVLPSLIAVFRATAFKVVPIKMTIVDSKHDLCPICQDQMIQRGPYMAKLSCGHHYCPSCIIEWGSRSNQCPICRAPLDRLPPNQEPPDRVLPRPPDQEPPAGPNHPDETTDFDQPD